MNRNRRTPCLALESLEGKQLMTGGLTYSLSAIPIVSAGHQQVDLTMTITNTSKAAEMVEHSSLDGFFAMQGGKDVWASNTGFVPMAIEMIDLAPGKSFQLSSTWNEESNTGPLKAGTQITGAVTFFNAIDSSDTETVTIPLAKPIKMVPLVITTTKVI